MRSFIFFAQRLRTFFSDRRFIISLALGYFFSSSFGQISITSDGFQYSQDFSSLVSSGTDVAWSNGTTLNSWYATNASGNLATYNAGSGGSTLPGLWSY